MTDIRGAELYGNTKVWYGVLRFQVESSDWAIKRFFTQQQKVTQIYTEYCFGRKIYEKKQVAVKYSPRVTKILKQSEGTTSIRRLFVFVDSIASSIFGKFSFIWGYVKVPLTYLCPYKWISLN